MERPPVPSAALDPRASGDAEHLLLSGRELQNAARLLLLLGREHIQVLQNTVRQLCERRPV